MISSYALSSDSVMKCPSLYLMRFASFFNITSKNNNKNPHGFYISSAVQVHERVQWYFRRAGWAGCETEC